MNARRFTPHRLPYLNENAWPTWPGPIDLEIGCGVGWHPIQYASNNPSRLLIAIERTRTKFASFQTRLNHHRHLKNIYPIHADAIHWITQCVPPKAIDNIFLLYPNPYPKNKHENKRFAQMPFMGFLLERMQDQAQLLLATNIAKYGLEAQDLLTNFWGLELIQSKLLPREFTPRTHFEKKYLLRNESCYEYIFLKPNYWKNPQSHFETAE